jgi:transposase
MNIDPQQKNEIISRWKNKQSVRGIAKELGLGRSLVARTIREHTHATQSSSAGSASAPPASLGPVPLTRKSKLDLFVDPLRNLMDRYPNITSQRAFEELRKLGYSGSYSTLRTYIKANRSKPKAPTVRFETAPGAQGQMDWSTYHIDFTQEGRRRVELFSYILSYSRRQYICFTERQDFETTVRQHMAAFEHLQGAASVCLYDNMKVVVTRWEDGQPIYNTRFLSFATHYGFKPWACKPKRPETKGKVERPFDYVEKNLLNGRTFRNLDHLNEVARWWLAQVNDVRIHGTTGEKPFDLHEVEKPFLIDLPEIRFDTAPVVYRIVDTEGFIQYADNRYSVPWRLIGQQIPVRILEDILEIFNASLDRVATHNLLRSRNAKQTDPSHLPPSDHAEQVALLREKYSRWGQSGLEYFDGVQKRCRNARHESQRILSLLHGYPIKDGQAAMQRGIQYHAYGYQSLERMLAHFGTAKANWELLSQREQEALQQLTESTRVEARPSKEYQHLLDPESTSEEEADEQAKQRQTQQPDTQQPDTQQPDTQQPDTGQASGEDPRVSGDSETQDDAGAA